MMEEPVSRVESPSGDSNLSTKDEPQSSIPPSLDERLIDSAGKYSFGNIRTPPTKKAKRIRFYRNGDKFYTGVVMAVTPERYRSFDSLATDLTRALLSSVTLPNGVRSIYSMDGKKIQNVIDLEDGKSYVVSGQGELFKKVEYSSTKVRRGNSLSGLPQSPAGTTRQIITIPTCVKAKIITLIRHGTKPRKIIRLLINKRNAASLEHVFEAITEVVKLDCGAVRRVYTLSGKLVIGLEQFFECEEVFLAYGNDKSVQDDFELDVEESKNVQSFRRGPWISKRQSGPMPVMPRKTGKRITAVPQIRTPSPSSLILPQPLRLQYSIGHVIGDGNFAVVRHCIHKTTNAEYAMKIVDKYKCQGKETMLASEVDILRQVCHPNIISLIGEQETADQLFLVMELVKGGDLFDAIAAVTKFSEAEASVMVGHLTSALSYLHANNIVHRDIKPENLLVEMEGSRVRCLKLGDFGLAQFVNEPLYTVCGTPTYVAPEILAETGYGLKIDVWAAGVILYILLCGFPPFVSPDNDQEELFERILSGQYEFTQPYWDPISISAKELIANMLQADPELRFTAEDVLDHPWLTRFLGGDETTGRNTTTNESSQQYGHQQCQSMRFTTKKQRCHSSSNIENATSSSISSITSGTRGFNVPFINENKKIINESYTTSSDKLNGNNIKSSISLIKNCCKNNNDITTSLNNLIKNIDSHESIDKKLSKSINSISEKNHSVTNLHSVNKNNDNTLSNIHSSIVTTTTSSSSSSSSSTSTSSSTNQRHDNKDYSQPKSAKNTNKKFKNYIKKSLTNNINKNNTGKLVDKKSDKLFEENSSIDGLSYSTDCISNCSDNNIETSDSFINIQFGNVKTITNCSSSTPSIDSSDSYENTRFDTFTHINNDNKISNCDSSSLSVNKNNDIADNNPKTSNRNSRLIETNIPKLSRVSMIPVVNGQQQLTSRINYKNEKTQTNEIVKYREKKLNNDDARIKNNRKTIDNPHKRFSCLPQYLGRKIITDSDKYRDVGGCGRGFSSTNELRDDEPKQCLRHSLYYTPQLGRKLYDESSKSLIRKCNRPMSWKLTGNLSKNSVDHAGTSGKQNFNRQTIVDTSKNKLNRQSIKGKATNSINN